MGLASVAESRKDVGEYLDRSLRLLLSEVELRSDYVLRLYVKLSEQVKSIIEKMRVHSPEAHYYLQE